MIWIKKTFPRFGAVWAPDMDRFADLQTRIAADGTDTYRKMLMVSVEEDADLPETEDVFLRLPDQTYAHLFPGYERAEVVPWKVTSLLVGDLSEFQQSFHVTEAG